MMNGETLVPYVTKAFKTFVAVAALVGSAFGASAATIDFTSAATGTSGTVNGIGWSMSSNVGKVNNSQLFDGQDSLPSLSGTGLAFQRDGYGVRSYLDLTKGDDEITTMVGNGLEAITITFTKPVLFTGISFLDLYIAKGAKVGEVGLAKLSNGTLFSVPGVDLTNLKGSKRAGYAALNVAGLKTNSIRIYIGNTNDGQGAPDGALASVSVAPVPVPAAGLLLVGGLGGLAALRRKRKAA